MQIPEPENELHSSLVKLPLLHASGQQRLMSLPQLEHHSVELAHVYDLPQAAWRQLSLSFGRHSPGDKDN